MLVIRIIRCLLVREASGRRRASRARPRRPRRPAEIRVRGPAFPGHRGDTFARQRDHCVRGVLLAQAPTIAATMPAMAPVRGIRRRHSVRYSPVQDRVWLLAGSRAAA
jgi:hypothetical protein